MKMKKMENREKIEQALNAYKDMSNGLVDMQSYFNRQADSYDVIHVSGFDCSIESRKAMAEYVPKEAKKLLDLGVGTGMELEYIYELFPEMEVVGVDISAEMLQKASQKYQDKSFKPILDDYFKFNMGVGEYDAIISSMTMHHYDVERKTQIYKKIFKALKSQGVYVENDLMYSNRYYDNPREMEEAVMARGREIDMSIHYDRPCAVDTQIEILKKIGFEMIEEVWGHKKIVILIAQKGE